MTYNYKWAMKQDPRNKLFRAEMARCTAMLGKKTQLRRDCYIGAFVTLLRLLPKR